MSPNQKFTGLLIGITFILFTATLVGWILSRRVNNDGSREVVGNLNTRIRSWWILVAIFAFAFFVGKEATLVLFALTSFFALREFITLTPTHPSDHKALSVSFFLIIPMQYYLIGIDWYGLFSVFIPVYGFLILPILSALAEDTDHFIGRAAKIQWGVMIAIYCISHVPALLILKIPGYEGQNAMLMFYMLLIVQISDVCQYIFGKIFGKTKIAPLISPSKTVEGFIGGGISAILVGAAMWWITPFTPLQAGGMACIIVLMGFFGGIVLSAVKRSIGVKDWGTMIKGHGGMLDRMDSVSFAAPIFFHVTRYFFT